MPAIEPPASRTAARTRFDDTAIERLEVLLHQDCLPQGGLPLEAVDGLFSCAWVSPGAPLTLEDLLPVVLGSDVACAPEELVRLLHLMWDATGQRIMRGSTADPRDCLPLIGIPPELDAMEDGDPEADAFDVGSAWALGFLLAYNLRAPEWELRLDQDEDVAWDMMDIFALMPPMSDEELDPLHDADDEGMLGDEDDDLLDDLDDEDFQNEDDEDDEPASFEERMAIIGALPDILHDLHQLTIDERTPRTPARREEAPARNDPCPCGSGKKFKKCHGDPSRLN